MRQLVDRCCGELIPCVQAPEKSRCKQHCAIVMNGWVAKITGDRVSAVLRVNALKVQRDFVESFVPTDALPTLRCAADRMFEAVFIIVKILQGDGLGADVPSAERVFLVTADVETLIGLKRDLNATYRFAEIAVAIMAGAIVAGSHRTRLYLASRINHSVTETLREHRSGVFYEK